jgi:hypothetical protein
LSLTLILACNGGEPKAHRVEAGRRHHKSQKSSARGKTSDSAALRLIRLKRPPVFRLIIRL